MVGYPFVEVSGCQCIASPFLDCPTCIGHPEGCPWRVERSRGREDSLLVPPCKIEREFGKIYETARPEDVTYVVDQIAVVADLIAYGCVFYS